MDDQSRSRTQPASRRGGQQYPLHKVVAAVPREQTDGVVTALEEAGFARDRIEVVTKEDVPDLDVPIGGTGVRGLLTRFSLSLGDDLDELERARQELMYGHALILVMVDGMPEQERAHTVMRDHGGHAMRYFGRWAITSYEGDVH
jgi:hypothetical protein